MEYLEIKWKDEITEALKSLGGEANLQQEISSVCNLEIIRI